MAGTDGDELLVALHAAVTLARSERITSLDALRSRLAGKGFTEPQITGAVRTWADYYARQHYQP